MAPTLAAALLIAATPIACGPASLAHQVDPEGDEVIALERAALDRWGKGDVDGFLSLYADEITYFDPFQDRRVDGVMALRALYGPLAGKFTVDRYVMLNPKVQRSGDVAVLTYNLQNYARQADGTERPTTGWNSSAVFRRIDGQWRTIHLTQETYCDAGLRTSGLVNDQCEGEPDTSNGAHRRRTHDAEVSTTSVSPWPRRSRAR